MDISSLFAGLNLAMIGGIIGILLAVRAVDRKHRLGKGAYVIGSVVLGFVAGALTSDPLTLRVWLERGITYAGAASILYQFGKLLIPEQLNPDRYWVRRPK